VTLQPSIEHDPRETGQAKPKSMERRGIEPLTSWLQTKAQGIRSPST
jgi:hypothetical protein